MGLMGLGAIAVLGACAPAEQTTEEPVAEEEMAMEEESMAEGTVVEVAAGNESFSTLVQAIEAAELAEVLSAEGPYTVFAPTNEAFAALPEGTLDQLLLPENQDLLAQILTYHVIPAEVPAAEVTTGSVATVAGPEVDLAVDDATGDVMVNNAMVIMPDVEASNGVIHAIDQVLLPPDVAL
ncbi:fasciclin [filamentous cyanobacterium CCP5]|nr:fasciclin [filamentous cyanobacterium CCP5]